MLWCCCQQETGPVTLAQAYLGEVGFRDFDDLADNNPYRFGSPSFSNLIVSLQLLDDLNRPADRRRFDQGVGFYVTGVPPVPLASLTIRFHGNAFSIANEQRHNYEFRAALRTDISVAIGVPATQVPAADFTTPIAWDQDGFSWTGFAGQGVFLNTPNLAAIANQVTALPGWNTSRALLITMRATDPPHQLFIGQELPRMRTVDEFGGNELSVTYTAA